MSWDKIFPRTMQPCMEEIDSCVNNPNWEDLNKHIISAYGIEPKIEYSNCSCARGWNVKYKKGGRSLCVLYPEEGGFICLVSIGRREAPAAEEFLSGCTEYVRSLYENVNPFNGARWLMIRVTSQDIAEDVKKLISTRVK